MHNLIRIVDGVARVEDDDWVLFAEWPTEAFDGRALLPYVCARAHADELDTLGEFGLVFAPTDNPAGARDLLVRATLVAVGFPSFADGRGYSTAFLLRTRLGWTGELRAVGDVLRDQLFYMRRVGFTSFAVRADRSAHDALGALHDFSDSYQGSVEPAQPLFNRFSPGASA